MNSSLDDDLAYSSVAQETAAMAVPFSTARRRRRSQRVTILVVVEAEDAIHHVHGRRPPPLVALLEARLPQLLGPQYVSSAASSCCTAAGFMPVPISCTHAHTQSRTNNGDWPFDRHSR
jgi:hypothetical protein